jgi:hypothetical protein
MTMSIWKRGITTMLRRTGEEWTAIVDDEAVTFYAVFDQENRLEDANGQTVLIAGSVLTMETSVAKRFSYNTTLTNPDGDTWYVREKLKVDDGLLSRVSITEDLTNPETC